MPVVSELLEISYLLMKLGMVSIAASFSCRHIPWLRNWINRQGDSLLLTWSCLCLGIAIGLLMANFVVQVAISRELSRPNPPPKFHTETRQDQVASYRGKHAS